MGHNWKQQGVITINEWEKEGTMPMSEFNSFLFFCPRCHSFKEYTCKYAYQPTKRIEEEVDVE